MNVSSKILKLALDKIRPIISRRNTLPVLSCVRLHAEPGWLHIAASNLDEYIIERVECEGEIAQVCVSLNQLDLALSGGSALITVKKDRLLVVCGRDETEISTIAAEEFPAIPKMEKAQTHGVSGAELAKSIKAVSWSASTDVSRYLLQSVLIESGDKKLSVVATNGRELSIAETALIGSKFELVVPSAFCGNFSVALSRSGAILSSNENWLRVVHDSGSYFCKLMEGNYPNYKRVIPEKMNSLGSVNVETMVDIAEGCLGYDTSKGEAKAKFSFSKDGLVIDFAGENNSKLTRQIDGKFEPLTVSLSMRKIQLIFSHLETDDAKLFFVDELSPLRIEAGELSVLTMPFRLS